MATEKEKEGARKHAAEMSKAPQWREIAENAPSKDPAYIDHTPQSDPQYIGMRYQHG